MVGVGAGAGFGGGLGWSGSWGMRRGEGGKSEIP